MTDKSSMAWPRLALWLALALPAAWITIRYALDIVSYGEVIHFTGDLSVQLLILTMAATPFRLMFPARRWPLMLMRARRNLGVASFAYAALHLAVYVLRKADGALILSEGRELGLATGWAAFALFMPLALTSNDASLRLLRRAWKGLHRLIYPAAALALAHWVLTAFDQTLAFVHLAILGALELVRTVLAARRRPN